MLVSIVSTDGAIHECIPSMTMVNGEDFASRPALYIACGPSGAGKVTNPPSYGALSSPPTRRQNPFPPFPHRNTSGGKKQHGGGLSPLFRAKGGRGCLYVIRHSVPLQNKMERKRRFSGALSTYDSSDVRPHEFKNDTVHIIIFTFGVILIHSSRLPTLFGSLMTM